MNKGRNLTADNTYLLTWVSIKDQMPPMGQGILISDGQQIAVAEIGYLAGLPHYLIAHGFRGMQWTFDFEFKDIKYWMPLPSLPID